MAYQGPERRKYKVLVTNNTEYHLREARVVGVRDVNSGEWRRDHKSLGSELVATLFNADNGGFKIHVGTDAVVGARLCFDTDIITSPLLDVQRPPREVVAQYAA